MRTRFGLDLEGAGKASLLPQSAPSPALAAPAASSQPEWAKLLSGDIYSSPASAGGPGEATIIGNSGDNTLAGTGVADSIFGGDGNDTIDGGGGADTSNGGNGDDYIFAVLGTPESIDGGAGLDTLDTTAFGGNYVVNLSSGATNFAGESFINMEHLISGAGDDSLTGTGSANSISGGDGADTINGAGGADTSNGGAGDDYIFAVLGTPESINGGAGNDTLDTTAFGGDYAVNLTTGLTNFAGESFLNLENLLSGAGNDSLTGTAGANLISGGAGNDTIRGNGGADTSLGGNGDDYIFASLGTPESINGGAGNDTLDTSAFTGDYVVNLATGLTNFSGESFLAMENLISGSGDDSLTGTGSANLIVGGSGNDTINGAGGADTSNGGSGNDYIFAVLGTPESIDGGAGTDTLDTTAFTGNYAVNLGTGATNFAGESFVNMEYLISGSGDDTLTGSTGNNSINGGSGNDSLNGGDGNDTLNGGGGADTAQGGNGDDYIFAVVGTPESIDGGAGTDTLNTTAFTGNYVVNLGTGATNFAGETFLNMENLVSGTGDDSLTGTSGANSINGGTGNDTINGGGGADTSLGGAGNDYIFAVLGTPESIDGGSGTDTLDTTAFTGNYVVNLATGATNFAGESFVNLENLISGSGDDTLTGSGLANNINGGSGADSIDAGAGNDTLNGGGGADTTVGGTGNDYIFAVIGTPESIDGGSGTDTLDTSAFAGNYVVNLATGLTNFAGESFVSMENLISGAGNDSLTGTGSANSIDGGAGNDTINGGNGADTVIGGIGNDYIFAVLGTPESIDGGAGNDTLNTAAFTGNYVVNLATGLTNFAGESFVNLENLFSGAGDDSLTGTGGANLISGGDGNDTINAAGGADTSLGGNGNDYIFAVLGTPESIDGGAGIDTLDTTPFSGNYVVNLATGLTDFAGESFTAMENLISGAGNDSLTGTGSANSISGGGGNDTINAAGGADTSLGGNGDDYIFAVLGTPESIDGGVGIDTLDTTAFTGDYVVNLTTGLTNFALESFINMEHLFSGAGNDLLIGTAGANTISGGDGNDTINASGGADTSLGGNGDDYIVAVIGVPESIDGGAGTDILDTSGFSGDYVVDLTTGLTNFAGESFINMEHLISGAGDDSLTGTGGDNSIDGGDGNDTIHAAGGADTSLGGNGDDYIFAVLGTPETINGGAGVDTLDTTAFTGDYVVNLATGATNFAGESFLNMEHVISGIGNDTLLGTGVANAISGGDGNDLLSGGGGDDTMTGGNGDDTFVVANAGDVVVEAAGGGADLVRTGVSYSLTGTVVEALAITGSGDLNATGNGLGNTLTGNDGDNILDGKTGNDTMVGNLGDDSYFVDTAGDVVTEAAGQGIDTILASLTYSLAGKQVENLILLAGAIDGTGNGFGNVLTGNAVANTLDAGGGHDRLDGGAGADTLIGGTGNDTYVVDNAGDAITEVAGGGADLVESTATYGLAVNVENLTLLGLAAINGTGNDLNNVLTGNGGNNVLSGGLGNDTYFVQNAGDNVVEAGGAGTDVIFSTVSYTLNGRFAETLTLTGAASVNATGNSLANTLNGNDGNNTLNGKGGADVLTGGLGADLFLFEVGSGADKILDFSQAQGDHINVNAYTAGVVNNALVTQSGSDVLINLGGGNIITVINALEANVEAQMVW